MFKEGKSINKGAGDGEPSELSRKRWMSLIHRWELFTLIPFVNLLGVVESSMKACRQRRISALSLASLSECPGRGSGVFFRGGVITLLKVVAS